MVLERFLDWAWSLSNIHTNLLLPSDFKASLWLDLGIIFVWEKCFFFQHQQRDWSRINKRLPVSPFIFQGINPDIRYEVQYSSYVNITTDGFILLKKAVRTDSFAVQASKYVLLHLFWEYFNHIIVDNSCLHMKSVYFYHYTVFNYDCILTRHSIGFEQVICPKKRKKKSTAQ